MFKPNSAADYYEILEVSPNASEEVIEKAYKTLAKKYHPDGLQGNAEWFKAINDAYTTLSHTSKRQQYDRQRQQYCALGVKPGKAGFGINWGSLKQKAGRLLLLFAGLGFFAYYGKIFLLTPIGKFLLLIGVGLIYFKWVKPRLKS